MEGVWVTDLEMEWRRIRGLNGGFCKGVGSGRTRVVTGQVVWVWIIMRGCALLVDLWWEGETPSFKHLLHELVDPG